jgi:uncharacterized protein YbjQ (UPF0145 family)
MTFFGDSDGSEPSDRRSESRDSLGASEVSGDPHTRPRVVRSGATFTSGLSTSEFALLDKENIRPLAQVMGASVVQVTTPLLPALPPRVVRREGRRRREDPSRWQGARYGWEEPVVCELGQSAHAWNLARRLAFRRLRAEAVAVGGDLVLGVRLKRATLDLGEGTIDLVVTGTAVRRPDGPAAHEPVLTGLSAQQYWLLHRSGLEPTGLLLATSVVFASPARRTRLQRARARRRNWEFDELSRGFRLARARVREQMTDAATKTDGEGIVGVELAHLVSEDDLEHRATMPTGKPRGWQPGLLGVPYYSSGAGEASRSGHIITMHAAGTAIRRVRDVGDVAARLSLRMRPIKPQPQTPSPPRSGPAAE